MENEGQCNAYRNWIEGKDGFWCGTQVPPLSASLITVILGLLAQDGDAKYYTPELLWEHIGKGVVDIQIVRKATQTFLQGSVVSPAKLVRVLEKDIKLLYLLWPMLTECIKYAGELVLAGESPPVWVNRILDVTLRYAPYLLEAVNHGFIHQRRQKSFKRYLVISTKKMKRRNYDV